MKIAICDDDVSDIKHLSKSIKAHFDTHEIIEFLSVDAFLKQIYSGESFDILFLDVQMPNANGWEIAKKLKQAKHKIFIAMVTVHGEYIFDCFDRVDWFAPKPVSQEKVSQILNSAQERLFPRVFELQTDNLKIALIAPEIIYFEIQRNTLFVHTTGGCHKTRLSLKKAKEMLVGCSQFVQTHSSFIINLDHYDRITGSYITLKNQKEIKLSRTFRDSFYKVLSEYVRSG